MYTLLGSYTRLALLLFTYHFLSLNPPSDACYSLSCLLVLVPVPLSDAC
jgi:hypothetical protein